MATLESIEELGACIKSTRKHLKALEEASAARRTDAGITDTAILQLVTSALTYHRKQYDVWMQMKLDRFADVSWDECHLEVPDESRKTSLESSPVRGRGAAARRLAGRAVGRPVVADLHLLCSPCISHTDIVLRTCGRTTAESTWKFRPGHRTEAQAAAGGCSRLDLECTARLARAASVCTAPRSASLPLLQAISARLSCLCTRDAAPGGKSREHLRVWGVA